MILQTTSKQEEEEETDEVPASGQEASWTSPRPTRPARFQADSVKITGRQAPHRRRSLGPVHTHAVWRGVLRCGAPSLAAIRFLCVNPNNGSGEGTLRLSNASGNIEREVSFAFGVESVAREQDEGCFPEIDLHIRWEDAEDPLATTLRHLRVKNSETRLLNSPVAMRSLSLSPPPMRPGRSPPALSMSLPASSRRPSFTHMNWASIVRGGPAEAPMPSPVSEDEEPDFTNQTSNKSYSSTCIALPEPVGIPGVALPNVFDDNEFPAPCSPPARQSRRRHASTGHMNATMLATPSVAAGIPLKARPPICGSFWSHCRLTIGDENKPEETLDLRYYGASGSDQDWHRTPAVTARTFASAGRRIL